MEGAIDTGDKNVVDENEVRVRKCRLQAHFVKKIEWKAHEFKQTFWL